MPTPEELDEFLKPEYRSDAPVQPRPAPTGIMAPKTTGGVDPRIMERIVNLALAEGSPASSDVPSVGQLVSTKPDWFQGGPPPQQDVGMGVLKHLAGSAAQGAQAKANLSAKEPFRKFRKKVADQGRANMLGAGAGVLGYLADRKQQNFAQEQDAALKQAQMHKALNSGDGSSSDMLKILLGAGNLQERVSHNAKLEEETARKAEIAREERDPNSQTSKEFGEAMLATGIWKPEQIAGRNKLELAAMKEGVLQGQRQDEGASEFDRRKIIEQAATISKANMDQTMKVENERREEQKRREQIQIPGYKWRGSPPDTGTANKVRDVVAASDQIDESAKKLTEIQDALNKKGFALAAFGSTNKLLEGILGSQDREAIALVEQGRQWQRVLSDAYRRRADFGTLGTPKEAEMAQAINQTAASPEGWLIGREGWDAIRNANAEVSRALRQSKGLYADNEAVPPGATDQHELPTEQLSPRFALPQQTKKGGAPAAVISEPVRVPGPAGGTKRNYSITLPSGKTVVRPLSEEEAVKLLNKLGEEKVRPQ